MGICLSNERYEEIKKIVADVFQLYDVSCVPVNGFELATKMGIKIIPYSAFLQSKRQLLLRESEDGFSVEKNSGEWYIFYNDEKPYRRINNTIMHEIGHIVLDHTEDSELAEKEVNFFAKYALAPPVLIHRWHLTEPIEVADKFEISYEAAEYACNYYKKWLAHYDNRYKDYEITIIRQLDRAG